ncbi:MAG: class I SAM-dependent methyltransferase [Bacteriovoracia bacterium]
MHAAYQPHYERALTYAGAGALPAALLAELREYLRTVDPQSAALDDEGLYGLCKQAPDRIFAEWKRRKIDPTNEADVKAFYVDFNLYCYELVAIDIDATLERQAQLEGIARLLREGGKLKGCDYGSGIGTLGIYLNRQGVRCDFADVSQANLDFVAQRLRRREIKDARLIHLEREELPRAQYDFVTAFDVLEHVANPLSTMRGISERLKPGGYFIFNLLYHQEPDTPHILMDPNPIRKNIRGFGLRKIASIGEFKVYQKVNRGAFGNALVRGLDVAFWNLRERVDALRARRRSTAAAAPSAAHK